MKVLFVGTLPPRIGISPYCLHLSYSISKKIDLEFIGFKKFLRKSKSFQRENKIDDKFYSVILDKLKIKKILSWYNPFSGLIAGCSLQGDIIHVQWWIPSLFYVYFPLLIMAKIRKIKIIISIHNILPHEHRIYNLIIDRIANYLLLPLGDSYIVHNVRNKKQLIELYNIKGKKINIITHGVFNLISGKQISKKDAMDYLNLPFDKKVILFFGYIRPYKGLDILIESFFLLRKKIKNVLLLIVGQPLYDVWQNYQDLINKLKLQDSVRIELGFAPENTIRYYFSASDVIVLPYKHLDTHGGVGALGVAFNKPMVVTDVGGSPEFIKDKRVLVKPNNVQDLTKSLKLVLEDKYLYEKLVNDSKDISKKLSWDNIAEQTLMVYNRIK